MGSFNFRVGHLGTPIPKPIIHKRAPNASCLTGGFYTSPKQGQVVDSSQALNITWDATCLNTTAADIYLYAPALSPPLIRMFQTVDFSKGAYETTLKPRWWGALASVDLQLVIIEHDMAPFMATLPAAPIWSAKYIAPPAGQPVPADADASIIDSGITVVNNIPSTKPKGPSKGGIAAAVLVPLIIVGLAIAAYIKWARIRQLSRRKRFSEAVDKRMSVISGDWRSMTAKGADAAIRASYAGDRMSTYGRNSTFNNRSSSTYATEENGDDNTEGGQAMTQIRRPGVGPRGQMPSSGDRVSRISFAADTRFSRVSIATRPSGESRRAGVQSRAFHSSYIPPVPTVTIQVDGSDSDPDRAMSPTQREGPLTLSADDIRARVRGLQTTSDNDPAPRPSIDEVIPALSMMRTRNGSHADLLFGGEASPSPAQTEFALVPPPPVATAPAPSSTELPKSPISGAMPMSMHPADSMSPDEMLRVYAERRRTGASSTTAGSGMMSPMSPMSPPTISFPLPVATPNAAGVGAQGSSNPFRRSMAVKGGNNRYSDEFDYEEAYLGTAA